MNFLNNIRKELKELDKSKKQLRHFGLVVGGIFFAIFLVILFWKDNFSLTLFLIGGLLILFGLVVPKLLKHVYIFWMSLSIFLGHFIGTIILTILFYSVILPIGVLVKIFVGDLLNRKIDREQKSYWIERKNDRILKEQMEKLF